MTGYFVVCCEIVIYFLGKDMSKIKYCLIKVINMPQIESYRNFVFLTIANFETQFVSSNTKKEDKER